MDKDKITRLADLLEDHIRGRISETAAAKRAGRDFTEVSSDELALAEQRLTDRGLTDEEIFRHTEAFLVIFADVLTTPDFHLAPWHPIHSYQAENAAVTAVLQAADGLSRSKFIPNRWAEIMEQLQQYERHLARKQNQLYPAFERQHFDRPSKIMWSLDDQVKEALRSADRLLAEASDEANENRFFSRYDQLVKLLHELMDKENIVLYPAAMEMIPTREFLTMRAGDEEIGYCLIATPPPAPTPGDPRPTPATAPAPAAAAGTAAEAMLAVRQGQLTLTQLNLIFRHLPVDLSFVDEQELVRFYSDTKHRIFPRSPGVIGRDVKNCHPRESVAAVEQLIAAFRAGRRDQAEFWLEIDGKFIYIVYIAVRDEDGHFKGVLEMMQDATHIRSLTGSRRIQEWAD